MNLADRTATNFDRALAQCLFLAAFTSVGCASRAAVGPCSSFEASSGAVDLDGSPVRRSLRDFVVAYNSRDPERVSNFIAQRVANDSDQPPAARAGAYVHNFERTGCLQPKKVQTDSEVTALVVQDGYGEWSTIDARPASGARSEAITLEMRPTWDPNAGRPASEADLMRQLSAWLRKAGATDRFSGVVLVTKDNQPILQQAEGFADRQRRVGNRLDTAFNIGSITKSFTAVAIAQLAAAGKLSLTDTLAERLPEYTEAGSASATLDQLLMHTSGLNADLFGPRHHQVSGETKTLPELIRQFAAGSVRGTGGHFEYSNFGYCLLGRVVEVSSGLDYPTYLSERIFAPAGMHHSGFWNFSNSDAAHATGYTSFYRGQALAPGTRLPNAPELPLSGNPAGGSFSSAPDLAAFVTALNNGALLDRQASQDLTRGRAAFAGGRKKYGYGFVEYRQDAVEQIGNDGGLPGATAFFRWLPELGYTVVVLSNYDGPMPAPEVGRRIVWQLGAVAATKPAVALSRFVQPPPPRG